MADSKPATKKTAATKSAATGKPAEAFPPTSSSPAVGGDDLVKVSDDKPAKSTKQPPVQVPAASRTSSGFSKRTKTLQVMLTDLGLYTGRIDGYYTTAVRNAVSALQQNLSGYQGRPNGTFNEDTRTALLESDIPTTT